MLISPNVAGYVARARAFVPAITWGFRPKLSEWLNSLVIEQRGGKGASLMERWTG
jgi:hypothetical protein